jgi:hypothetical protein
MLRREREGKGGKGERWEIFPPCLGVEKSTRKKIDGICDKFTILSFFLLKSIHCVILFCPFWE